MQTDAQNIRGGGVAIFGCAECQKTGRA